MAIQLALSGKPAAQFPIAPHVDERRAREALPIGAGGPAFEIPGHAPFVPVHRSRYAALDIVAGFVVVAWFVAAAAAFTSELLAEPVSVEHTLLAATGSHGCSAAPIADTVHAL